MYRTVEYNGQKLTLKYTIDEIFKYILTSDDSYEYTSFLLHSIVNKPMKRIKFIPTEMINRTDLKKQIYDTLIIDQDNNDYITEMQNGPITASNGIRFQNYSNSRCIQKITKGSNYEFPGLTDLIVFTTHKFGNELLNIYDLKDMDGKSFPYNLQHYYVVSLPFVKELDLEKGFLTDLEVIAYMFYFGNVDDVYHSLNELQRKMVNFMERKYNEVIDNPFLLPKVALDALEQLEKEEVKEIYHQEGIEIGKTQGIEIGKTQGIEIGKNQEKEEERKKRYLEYLDQIPKLMKLIYDDIKTDWLNKLSYDQLEEMFSLLLSGISYDDLFKKYFDGQK